jgi:excisionase family DNA binding protein
VDLKTESLLSVDRWAEKVGIKPSTARAWLLRRKIAYVKVGKRAVRIPLSEAERILREGYVPAKEDLNHGR